MKTPTICVKTVQQRKNHLPKTEMIIKNNEMGENIYKTHLIRGKYPKICKGLKQVNIIKTNTQLHTVEMEWTFLESGHADAQLSRFFTPLIIRNIKGK